MEVVSTAPVGLIAGVFEGAISMLRKTDKATGQASKVQGSQGERARDARRERNCRDVTEAINKGYRNQAITEFFRK